MSNPDIKNTGMKAASVDTLYIATPVAILFVLITITLFYLKDSIPNFNLVVWLSIPLAAAIITAVANTIIQYTTCNTVNIGKALLGTVPTIIAVIVGLGLSSISYCRIPIVSVFAPLFIKKTTTNSKECCSPKLNLKMIEFSYPLLVGFSYGFYVMFSILFGMVIGTGISRIC